MVYDDAADGGAGGDAGLEDGDQDGGSGFWSVGNAADDPELEAHGHCPESQAPDDHDDGGDAGLDAKEG